MVCTARRCTNSVNQANDSLSIDISSVINVTDELRSQVKSTKKDEKQTTIRTIRTLNCVIDSLKNREFYSIQHISHHFSCTNLA